MTTFINVLRIIVQVFPALVALVRAIEEAAPARDLGAEKLEIVKGIISDAYDALSPKDRSPDSGEGLPLEGVLAAAISIVNRIVRLLNKAGWPAGN